MSVRKYESIPGRALHALGIVLMSAQAQTDPDEGFAILSGTGAPSGATYGGQTLATGQCAIALRADAATTDTTIHVTVDGGTTWQAIDVGPIALASLTLPRRRIIRGSAADVGEALDLGANQGIPYSDGTDVLRGTIQDHGASTSTSTAPGATDTGTTGITASGAATSSDTTGITASGAATSSDTTGITASSADTASDTTGITASSADTASDTTGITASGASTAASGTGAVTGTSAAGNAALSTSNRRHMVTFTNPAAAGTNIVAQMVGDVDESTWANITQPGVPRVVQVVTNAAWDGGNIEISGLVEGTGQDGTETITVAVGGGTVQGGTAFRLIRRVRNLSAYSAGACDVQQGIALGLPCEGLTPTLLQVYETSAGGLDAGASVSPLGAVIFTDAPNGVRDYAVSFSVQPNLADSGHSHGAGTFAGPSHDHAAGAITVTDTGHTHAAGAITVTDTGHTHAAGAITVTDTGHTHTSGAITVVDTGHDHAHTATHHHDTTPPAHQIA